MDPDPQLSKRKRVDAKKVPEERPTLDRTAEVIRADSTHPPKRNRINAQKKPEEPALDRAPAPASVPTSNAVIPAPVPEPLPAAPVSFDATTIDGAEFSLQKLRGKVVLLDLISVHCSYCFSEVDDLQELKRRYPDVVFVAVATGETADEVRTSLAARDLPFPFPVIADPQSRLLESVPSYGTPTHVVLDREGRFTNESVVIGANSRAVLERVIRLASGLPARRVFTAQ